MTADIKGCNLGDTDYILFLKKGDRGMYNALMILCLVLIMFGSVAGCSQNQQDKIEETVVENSVMTSAFYEGIDSVELVGADVIIDDKEVINEIKNYILSLEVTESEKNYIVANDGETRQGITRYGQWYGNPYGDATRNGQRPP